MFKKSILRDATLFIIVVLFLLIVVPAISALLKQLIALQLIILVVGTIVLRYLVQKIRRRIK